MPDVRDGRVFEKVHDPTLTLAPYPVHAARPQQEAVRMLPDADVQRDRPLDGLDDVAERDPIGGACENVPPVRTAPRPHESLVDQLAHDLLEELARNPLPRGDLGHRAGAVTRLFVGEMNDRAQRVIDLPAYLHDRHRRGLL